MKVVLAMTLVCALHCAAHSGEQLMYPQTRTVDQVDDYHGTKISDPYRWLEDCDSDETKAWVAAQNKVTFGFLQTIPQREQIKSRLLKMWNYERYAVPVKEGGRYFFQKNNGLQNQSVLYWSPALDAEPRVLLDPNTLSADGSVSLNTYSVTEDGKLLAYAVSQSGSDWKEFRVRDVESGKDLSDHLKWVKFSSAAWTKDGKGFFYSRYDEQPANAKMSDAVWNNKLFYHRLGTPQSDDTLIYKSDEHKERKFFANVTDDGRYLIIVVWRSTDPVNALYYRDLQDPNGKVVELISTFENGFNFIGNDGPLFWFSTNLNAPRERVIAIDTRKPDRANWREVIPQSTEALQHANLVGDAFIVSYVRDAHAQVKIFGLDGTFRREVKFPVIGSAFGFGGRASDTETFYSFSSFTSPSVIYRYDMKSGESTVFRRPNVDMDAAAFETKQVFFTSKDGTRVPMFLTHRKGLQLDGSNPVYLTGYGGFNISLTPGFDPSNVVWLEMGGVLAVANIRGGGEYGEDWHKAAKKEKRQNAFDDFIGAAEWLIANKYTSTPKLAIAGGSNGGLLVGACMTQRPELFGAALPSVGVLDLLRYHKFTVGYAWVDEYGSSDIAEEFKALLRISPLHNLRKGTRYPPTMVMTADHDDRVVPGHSFKYAATLQAAQSGDAPVLIRVDVKAGHGMGKPISQIIESVADRWAFLVKTLNVQPR